MEGSSGHASAIRFAIAQCVPEPDQATILDVEDDDDDETYIDDGVIAPASNVGDPEDNYFFV